MRVIKITHYLARTGERIKIFAEGWQVAIHKVGHACISDSDAFDMGQVLDKGGEGVALGRGGR